MSNKKNILVVNNERSIREILGDILKDRMINVLGNPGMQQAQPLKSRHKRRGRASSLKNSRGRTF